MQRPRYSIAGLMIVVVVAALGLAALRNATAIWAGAISLLTFAWLGTAIVGALCRRGAPRAWWLGFAVFGCAYTYMATGSLGVPAFPHLPTTDLLDWLFPSFGHDVSYPYTAKAQVTLHHYYQIGQSLWALVAGFLGGTLARIFRDAPAGPLEESSAEAAEAPRRRWVRPAIFAWAGLLLACCVAAIASAGPEAETWAGAAFFLTCGVIGLFVLVAIYGRGRRRQAAVGAALFGAGYLILTFTRAPYQLSPYREVVAARPLYQPLPTESLINGMRRWTIAYARGHAAEDARIVAALEQPVEMTFPDPTPIRDVLRYVQMATSAPGYRGIPIYLDPVGLEEAEKKATSTVTIDLVGVPLRTSLRLCLEQIGLDYEVQGGVLRVRPVDDVPSEPRDFNTVLQQSRWISPDLMETLSDLDDPFLTVGHCLLALVAAGVGAIAGPIVAGAGREADGRRSRPVSDAHPT